jgi:hypothetical protein
VTTFRGVALAGSGSILTAAIRPRAMHALRPKARLKPVCRVEWLMEYIV